MTTVKSLRTAWRSFPDVTIHAQESSIKKHPDYTAAKAGEIKAARRLVEQGLCSSGLARLQEMLSRYPSERPFLVAVFALEDTGVNRIPAVMAQVIGERLELPVASAIVQINQVGHTGASGWHRLAFPAIFGGPVQSGQLYLLVDDFVGQGGTLANLRGYIESRGSRVIGATVLTGKPYSAKLAISSETLRKPQVKHGALENWWRREFGYGFDVLTESEARYLERAEDADTIRSRLAEARIRAYPR